MLSDGRLLHDVWGSNQYLGGKNLLKATVYRLRRTLTAMTEVETKHGRVRFDNDEVARTLSEDLKRRYGETVVSDLAKGKTDALAADFADPGMRQKIARAVVAAAVEHETIGLSLNEARAAQDRMRGEAERERSRDRSADRDREL